MIYNRVAGRDLNIASNFAVANAPVSYPFLWNASRQDHTQWTGAVPNGLYIQAMARNTGEVFGVFADFEPRKLTSSVGLIPTIVRYKDNSANFSGLQTLEEEIVKLQPPPWPRDIFGLDDQLAAKGHVLFDAHCGTCHGEKASTHVANTWDTPVNAVGTDPRTAVNAARHGDPGIYLGAVLPPPAAFDTRYANPAAISNILAGSVVGSLLDEAFLPPLITPAKVANSGVWRALRKDLATLMPIDSVDTLLNRQLARDDNIKAFITARLADLYAKPAASDIGAAYEARVLHGIWATAPLSSQRLRSKFMGTATTGKAACVDLHGRQSDVRPEKCRLRDRPIPIHQRHVRY